MPCCIICADWWHWPVVHPKRDSRTERRSVRAARLEQAKRYIDQHLAEPDLDPATTAAALGISTGHLHRLFEPTGTSFAQYVQRSRLLKCRDSLGSVSGAGRSVADIAFGWGFNSLATFYRAFAREFGSSPRSVSLAGDTTRHLIALANRPL